MNRHHHQTQHHHRMYSFHSRDSSCSTLIGLNFIGEEQQQEQFIHSSTHTPHYAKEKNNEPPLPYIEIHQSVTNEEKDRIHPLSISTKYTIQKNNKKETNKSLKKKKKKKMKSNNTDSSSFPMSIYRKLPLLLPPPPPTAPSLTMTTTKRSSLLEERSHSLEYSPDHSSTNNKTKKRLCYKHKGKVIKVEEQEE